MFPFVDHQPASPSIWPAVQSLRQGLQIPGDNVVSMWVQLKMMINISSCPPLSHLHVLKCQIDYYLTLLTTDRKRQKDKNNEDLFGNDCH